jgi:uncharacterized protein (DUF302 family)
MSTDVQIKPYCYTKFVSCDFDEAIVRITVELKKEEFGVVTEINMKEIMNKRLGIGFRKYTILGACNPQFGHSVMTLEPHAGTMLPCNIVVQEVEPGQVEVTVVDPVASLSSIHNPDLLPILTDVQIRLQRVLANI